jgi:hypothetical protein
MVVLIQNGTEIKLGIEIKSILIIDLTPILNFKKITKFVKK